MTVSELAELFPNGLHDAEVESLHVDGATRTVTMTIYVWVGSLEDPADEEEAYRKGTLEFSDVRYCSREPAADTASTPLGAAFTCRFWVDQWGGFVHLAAQKAFFSWAAEPENVDRSGP
jgi:hypothetical protein